MLSAVQGGFYLLDLPTATFTIKAHGTSASGQSEWEEAAR